MHVRAPLPLVDDARPQRADAAANRTRILRAAEGLFVAGDPRHVTVEEIARAAGVGRATVYRHFPTVGAVAEALLDEHERQLQARILRGPPPLGPGAAPADRLAAFYDEMLQLLTQHAPLVLGKEVGQVRYGTGAYTFWRAHVRHLATEASVEDPDVAAELLLAPLDPALFLHQQGQDVDSDRIARALRRLAAAVLGSSDDTE